MSTVQPPRALVVEDDADARDSLMRLVEREGFSTVGAKDLAQAERALDQETFAVLLVDLHLPDGDGLSLAEDSERLGGAELVIITGNAEMDTAIEALRRGALDYLTKPLDRPRLQSVLVGVARTRALRTEVSTLRNELRELGRFGRIVSRSESMQSVFDQIAKVAPTEASVLIVGESGTGKEVAAQTIHELSLRRNGAHEAVNCGAIPESLIESELFGHERGSFTGADKRKLGFFERADGGTLFLDEVTEMSADLQVRLLRVLETQTFHRVGGTEPIKVDVRVLAATNRDPIKAIEEGKLRQDLFYRLAVFPIYLPPLRERKGDITVLAEHFLAELNQEGGTNKRWTTEALRRLEEQPWEGNVRELKNAVQRAYILAEDELSSAESHGHAAGAQKSASAGSSSVVDFVGCSIADVERELILATLAEFDGDKPKAAETLGISLKTLYTRLKVYEAAAGRTAK